MGTNAINDDLGVILFVSIRNTLLISITHPYTILFIAIKITNEYLKQSLELLKFKNKILQITIKYAQMTQFL